MANQYGGPLYNANGQPVSNLYNTLKPIQTNAQILETKQAEANTKGRITIDNYNAGMNALNNGATDDLNCYDPLVQEDIEKYAEKHCSCASSCETTSGWFGGSTSSCYIHSTPESRCMSKLRIPCPDNSTIVYDKKDALVSWKDARLWRECDPDDETNRNNDTSQEMFNNRQQIHGAGFQYEKSMERAWNIGKPLAVGIGAAVSTAMAAGAGWKALKGSAWDQIASMQAWYVGCDSEDIYDAYKMEYQNITASQVPNDEKINNLNALIPLIRPTISECQKNTNDTLKRQRANEGNELIQVISAEMDRLRKNG